MDPTESPTKIPTEKPSVAPIMSPTSVPTLIPTATPICSISNDSIDGCPPFPTPSLTPPPIDLDGGPPTPPTLEPCSTSNDGNEVDGPCISISNDERELLHISSKNQLSQVVNIPNNSKGGLRRRRKLD